MKPDSQKMKTCWPVSRTVKNAGPSLGKTRSYLGAGNRIRFCPSRLIPPSDFEVSLVELELQNQEFISYVRTHGTVLYVRGEINEDS